MSQFSKVNTQVIDRKKAAFPMSHGVNTTSDFGHVQTIQCTYLPLGDTTISYKLSSLVRLAPMVAPTFGKIVQHIFNNFCPCSKIYPYFDNVITGVPVTFKDVSTSEETEVIINRVPYTTAQILSMLLLGSGRAHYTFWKRETDSQGRTVISPHPEDWYEEHFSDVMDNVFSIWNTSWNSWLGERLVPQYTPDYSPENAEYLFVDEDGDTIVTFDFSTKRMQCLYKHFLNAGYKIGFSGASYDVSVMPLLAIAKVIFDNQSIAMYDNYKSSPMWKLYNFYQSNLPLGLRGYNLSATSEEQIETNLFVQVLDYLSETYMTEDVNFVSAHVNDDSSYNQSSLSSLFGDLRLQGYYSNEGPTDNPIKDKFLFPNSNIDPGANNPINGGTPSFALESNSSFSQLDDEILKKLYYLQNKSSQIGYKLREQLVMRGFGSYCDEIDSTMLGYQRMDIEIESVTSLSDTYDKETNSGANLGQFGGRGVGYKENEQITYTAKEFGYLVVTMAILPQADFVLGLDKALLQTDPTTIYTPELDGFGFESSPNAILGKNNQIQDRNSREDIETYGYIPRFTGVKHKSNRCQGDMARRKYQNNYLPYQLDRFLTPSHAVSSPVPNEDNKYYLSLSTQPYLPEAGKEWRQPTRYPYLSNYNRIFINYDEGNLLSFNESVDNFIVHCWFNSTMYSRMLPVADSFETQEEEGKENVITIGKDHN